MKLPWEKSNICWTLEKPQEAGNYWYRRTDNSLSQISGKPRILFVNSKLCVPQLSLSEYKEPVSVEEYKGEWAGPISEPENNMEKDLDHLMWQAK